MTVKRFLFAEEITFFVEKMLKGIPVALEVEVSVGVIWSPKSTILQLIGYPLQER